MSLLKGRHPLRNETLFKQDMQTGKNEKSKGRFFTKLSFRLGGQTSALSRQRPAVTGQLESRHDGSKICSKRFRHGKMSRPGRPRGAIATGHTAQANLTPSSKTAIGATPEAQDFGPDSPRTGHEFVRTDKYQDRQNTNHRTNIM